MFSSIYCDYYYYSFLYSTNWVYTLLGMLNFHSTLQDIIMWRNFYYLCWYCYFEGNASLKKWVLSRDLNIVMSFAFLMWSGRSFQYFAAA